MKLVNLLSIACLSSGLICAVLASQWEKREPSKIYELPLAIGRAVPPEDEVRIDERNSRGKARLSEIRGRSSGSEEDSTVTLAGQSQVGSDQQAKSSAREEEDDSRLHLGGKGKQPKSSAKDDPPGLALGGGGGGGGGTRRPARVAEQSSRKEDGLQSSQGPAVESSGEPADTEAAAAASSQPTEELGGQQDEDATLQPSDRAQSDDGLHLAKRPPKSSAKDDVPDLEPGNGRRARFLRFFSSRSLEEEKSPNEEKSASSSSSSSNGQQSEAVEEPKRFGMPTTSFEAPVVGSHDFSHSDTRFQATRNATEKTQLLSGIDNNPLNNPKQENVLEIVDKTVQGGKTQMDTALYDQFGVAVPTKVEDGRDNLLWNVIKLIAEMLKNILVSGAGVGGVGARQPSRVPLEMATHDGEQQQQIGKERTGSSGDDAIGGQNIQRSMLETIQQLIRLGLDESANEDRSRFEQLLERIKNLIQGFRSKPTLRT